MADTGRVLTVAELGAEVARQVGRLIPHERYSLTGLDPVSGAACLSMSNHEFADRTRHQLEIEYQTNLTSLTEPVSVHGPDSGGRPYSLEIRDLMAAEGFSRVLNISLGHGQLVLLRERGSRPFSAEEKAAAARLAPGLSARLREFITAYPLHPARCELPPGVVMMSPEDRLTVLTPAGQAMLTALNLHNPTVDLWNITYLARRGGGCAVSRIPTTQGWIALQAQVADRDAVVITIQPASAGVLLPAVAAWYGITGRERQVVEQVLAGLPSKQIARRLELSAHTVNDHLKSIYRKAGVSSREELMSRLSN